MCHSVSANRCVGISRGRFLSGISLLALSLPLALTPVAAKAEEISHKEEFGQRGRSAVYNWVPFTSNTLAGPGGNTYGFDIRNNQFSNLNASGVAVLIGSMGGRGGTGKPLGSDTYPEAGGNAGNIGLVQNGALAGTGNLAPGSVMPRDEVGLCKAFTVSGCGGTHPSAGAFVTNPYFDATKWAGTKTGYRPVETRWTDRGGALLLVYSQGGTGGDDSGIDSSGENFSLNGRDSGGGGTGGAVTVTLNSTIKTTGENYGGAWVRSLGGNASPGAVASGRDHLRVHGGDSGAVTVTIGKSGSITTTGASSPAVIAESLAGSAHDQQEGRSNDSGARGGNGNNVILRNAGTITTKGASSPAVVIQSVGGAGGSTGYGKTGGRGGTGGGATAVNGGAITAAGKYSVGVFALSAGGSGGKGGAGLFVGGDGGNGGDGGAVNVSNYGAITTSGEGAAGIVAQSVSGGRTADAFQMKAIVPGAKSEGGGGAGGRVIFIGSGGDGGTGGNGKTVQVVQGGAIKTDGHGAFGVAAQSIGGGGGSGGRADSIMPFLSFALGGDGGSGGDGGEVRILRSSTLVNSNLIQDRDWALALEPGKKRPAPSIATTGSGAHAIMAQSIGGGGGVGGSATSKAFGYVGALAIAIGGDGAGGGDGGLVFVENESTITTSGIGSAGVYGQSIGGGGGSGGSALAYALAVSKPGLPSVSISWSVGGAGGKGGKGGDVKLYNYAPITTTGSSSIGIDAQSVGGGGGDAGSARSTSDAIGFYLDLPLTFTFGGTGGGGGGGGHITVRNESGIETSGAFSRGVSAISIGGGGGKGGSGNAKTSTAISWKDMLDDKSSTVSNVNDISDAIIGLLPRADSLSVQLTMGGAGGGGGKGGDVTVVNAGTIVTRGDNAKAIHAQSVGGGGGDAGGFLASGKATLKIDAKIGGRGGDGGDGGKVIVTNSSRNSIIETHGAGSVGVFAQSVGGGGGDGGGFAGTVKPVASMEGFKDQPEKYVFQLVDELLKFNDLSVYTNTNSTDKILSEMIADKNVSKEAKEDARTFLTWRSGESSFQKNIKNATSYFKIIKSMGTEIGRLARKDDISWDDVFSAFTVTATNVISQFKDSVKTWYKAQGFEKGVDKIPPLTIDVAVGGAGGKGGKGGDVEVTNEGKVTTYGDTSIAVLAQSVGGGGGRGGASIASADNTLNVVVAVGGSGGDGGQGGEAKIVNESDVTTHGGASIGLFAQSVGGGGGIGGAAASANTISLNVTAKVGGNAGKSSDGGKVSVTNKGNVTTHGSEAHGIVAQSVGGGGGTVFISRVAPDTPDVLAASKEMADALAAAEDMLKAVAGNVLKTEAEAKEEKTDPEKAKARQKAKELAGLLNMNVVGSTGGGTRNASTAILPVPSVGFSLGGDGGDGGSGGPVSVDHHGAIVTEGFAAMGIFAQSIGGGGGFGADAGRDGLLSLTPTLGGTGGVGGNGGPVTINLHEKSSISTAGAGAHGVFIQSIGGGGGYAGAGAGSSSLKFREPTEVREKVWVYPPPYYNGFTVIQAPPYQVDRVSIKGVGGDGGAVTVTGKKDISITTTGKDAHGLFAQSLGAGGGTAYLVNTPRPPVASNAPSRDPARMTGKGGSITIGTKGSILAKGEDAYGIFLQSGVQKTDGSLDASRRGGRIIVEHEGTLTGGSGAGAAIRIEGGVNDPDARGEKTRNEIRILPGSVVSAASGTAIVATFGEDAIINKGTIIGDVNLVFGGSRERNIFENNNGATYQSRAGFDAHIKLGHEGRFINKGTLSIAGDNQIGTLNIIPGDSSNKEWVNVDLRDGTLRVDLDRNAAGQKNDILRVRGGPQVEGLKIVPNEMSGSVSINDAFDIIQTLDGNAISGKPVVQASQGVPIQWQYTTAAISSQSVAGRLQPTADFAGAINRPLTDTEKEMVEDLQKKWNSGNDDTAKLFGALASVSSSGEYSKAVGTMSPEGKNRPAVMQTENSPKSLTAAMSCPVFVDDSTVINEGQCVWGRVIGSRSKLSPNRRAQGHVNQDLTFRVGAQWEVAKDWFVGASAAYTSAWGNTTGHYTSYDGKLADVSVSLKHQIGPWLFAGALHAGYGSNKIKSRYEVGDELWSSTADPSVWTGAARARMAYEFSFANWYLRPQVDADVMFTHMNGYVVPGNLYDLKIYDMNQWIFAVRPAIEVGTRLDINKDLWVRPYMTAGFSYFSHSGLDTEAEIFDTAAVGETFTSTGYLTRIVADFGAGMQFYAKDKYEFRGEYKAQVGRHYLNQEGSVRFSVRF